MDSSKDETIKVINQAMKDAARKVDISETSPIKGGKAATPQSIAGNSTEDNPVSHLQSGAMK